MSLEYTYIANRLAVGGIRLYDFIDYYLPKYFSWALIKRYGRSEILEEWLHHDKGTVQFYQELLGTDDQNIINLFIKQYCENFKIRPNDKCYCGSGLKLKKCHYNAVMLLKATSKKVLLKDLELFK